MIARNDDLRPSGVVLQPTTLCNLDCVYCYLPDRRRVERMPVAVARAVADGITEWARAGTVEVIWHGGEPLAAGLGHLDALMAEFDGLDVKHCVQTNATLIDDAWCDLFRRRDVDVGVSIDGPAALSEQRVNWAGRPAFGSIVRGISRLRTAGIDFGVIAVVSRAELGDASALYGFVAGLGASWLGVNVEEREGVNTRALPGKDAGMMAFWAELGRAWARNPAVTVREVSRVLDYARAELGYSGGFDDWRWLDPFPTVSHDGQVTLLSPELAGFTSARHGAFTCGSVLDAPLPDLVRAGMGAPWVREFRTGRARCWATCPYFDFCGGGHAANRHFEHGRLDGTETDYCRRSKIALFEGMITVADELNHSARPGEADTRGQ